MFVAVVDWYGLLFTGTKEASMSLGNFSSQVKFCLLTPMCHCAKTFAVLLMEYGKRSVLGMCWKNRKVFNSLELWWLAWKHRMYNTVKCARRTIRLCHCLQFRMCVISPQNWTTVLFRKKNSILFGVQFVFARDNIDANTSRVQTYWNCFLRFLLSTFSAWWSSKQTITYFQCDNRWLWHSCFIPPKDHVVWMACATMTSISVVAKHIFWLWNLALFCCPPSAKNCRSSKVKRRRKKQKTIWKLGCYRFRTFSNVHVQGRLRMRLRVCVKEGGCVTCWYRQKIVRNNCDLHIPF